MRIAIFTAGSQGDVQPCILLGRGLQQAGFNVLLAAPENFAGQAQAAALPFHPLHGDVQQIMAGETGQKYMETGGGNPIQAMLAMRKMIRPIAIQMAADALAACRQADALICLAVFAPIGKTLAEICGIPLINLEPTPLLPTRAFPAAGWPLQRNFSAAHNRLSGVLMLRMIWQWYGPFINEFRREHGLPGLRGADFQRILASVPLLGAYSPTLIAHPPDWSERVHITGYWFQDAALDWRPPAELEAFLAGGEPPVYVGFGSMAGRDPERLTAIVLQALADSGRRGLLLTGWGALNATAVPKNVFILSAAPHSWLFPRMAAVVHHGGAGTTAEGLRAGRPTVIVPFIVDQHFWGRRARALGVGPEPLPAKDLAAGQLAAAIQIAASDAHMQTRAAAVGAAIRREDGLGCAVSVVRRILGAGS